MSNQSVEKTPSQSLQAMLFPIFPHDPRYKAWQEQLNAWLYHPKVNMELKTSNETE